MSHLQYSKYEGFGQTVGKSFHYSQGVRIGDRIELSGQGGWDRMTEEVLPDLSQEIDQTFDNIEHALKDAGGKGWEQVYKVRAYCKPLNDEMLQHILRNFRKYCPNHQPLYTVVGVQNLGIATMNVEIEVEAHLGP